MAEDSARGGLDAQHRWPEPAPRTVFGTQGLWRESSAATSRSPETETNFEDEERVRPSPRFQQCTIRVETTIVARATPRTAWRPPRKPAPASARGEFNP